jgi:hypothetical protein
MPWIAMARLNKRRSPWLWTSCRKRCLFSHSLHFHTLIYLFCILCVCVCVISCCFARYTHTPFHSRMCTYRHPTSSEPQSNCCFTPLLSNKNKK